MHAQERLVVTMADAVRAVQNPRQYFPADVEQIPNPGRVSACNGCTDGYSRSGYAPTEITSLRDGRLAEFTGGMTTWIYGPETDASSPSKVHVSGLNWRQTPPDRG